MSARIRDLDLLVELGLGIDRRLNQERARQKQPSLEPPNVSFWYIANHLGKRFLHDARVRLGEIEEEGPGVWRSQILLRPLFLIDGRTVPVERDSVALHLAGEEAGEIDSALAQVIVEVPGYWETYGPLLKALHPNVWKEATNMARSKGKRGDLDLTPFIEDVGLAKLLALVKVGDVIDTVGVRKVVKELGVERFLANLSAEDRQKLKERLK